VFFHYFVQLWTIDVSIIEASILILEIFSRIDDDATTQVF